MIIFHPKKLPLKGGGMSETEAESLPGGDEELPPFPIKDFPQNHILYHIHKNGTRQGAPRHHNVVHASDLDPARNWCPREPALLTLHDKKRPSEFTSTAQRMVWQMGYKGADLVMDMIPSKKLWGNWRCLACKQEIKLVYKPDACPYCEAHPRALEYQEVFLRDPDTGVVGSVDLFVDILGNGMKTALEIKTEGNESFKARSKPEFDHEWRTMLYMHLASKNWNGDFAKKHGINLEAARIIYVTKEGYAENPKIKEWKLGDWARSSMKEYFVLRNDEMVQPRLELAMTYREWRNQWDAKKEAGAALPGSLANPEFLPPRAKGAISPGCTRCKGCPVKLQCWSGTA